jgi:hypothetical protein
MSFAFLRVLYLIPYFLCPWTLDYVQLGMGLVIVYSYFENFMTDVSIDWDLPFVPAWKHQGTDKPQNCTQTV